MKNTGVRCNEPPYSLLQSHSLLSPLQANDAGDFFPIWGTCQGFQQLSVLTAHKNLLTLTDTKAVALPLTLTPGILLFSCTFVRFFWDCLYCLYPFQTALSHPCVVIFFISAVVNCFVSSLAIQEAYRYLIDAYYYIF